MLDELFGGSKKSQQERLNERLARKKQLIAERRASGLNTDEATINAIIEDEEIQEEKRKRRVKLNLFIGQTIAPDKRGYHENIFLISS